MDRKITIRFEEASDVDAISRITESAFRGHPYSRGTEPFIINSLRRASALSVSLVAECDGEVVGHIAFSPVEISDGAQNWQALGPVSVKPELQGRGIGSALVRAGLEEIRKHGTAGCVLIGEPAFYGRFGFRSVDALTMDGISQEFVLSLPFSECRAAGTVIHHPAFHAEK
jgi:putative acetyltransferase